MLAVAGHTTRDLVDTEAPRPGGAPLYAARALALLGEPGLIVTRCAAADEPLLAPLHATGVPVVWRPAAVSPTFRLRYRDTAREVSIEALGEPWLPEDADGWLREALAGVDWLHAAALWRGEFPKETLARLARGRTLSLDGQGLVRPGVVGAVVHDAGFDRELLAHVSVLHLSEDEAGALGLELDGTSLGSLGVPEVVVTLGERGSVVWTGKALETIPASPVADADPTGAGDAFMTVYLARRRSGDPPAAAARRATTVVQELLAGTRA
jgi:sugar/nucleoside kinase (ribokinase family)